MVRRVSDAADRTEQGAKVASAQGGGNPVAQVCMAQRAMCLCMAYRAMSPKGRQGTPCSAVRFQFLANSASQLSTFWATNLVKLTNCTAECINIAASVIACISASRVEHCIDLEECMHANTTANTYAFWLPRTRPRTAHHHRPPRHHNNCRNRRVRACEQPGVQGLLPHNMARPARDPERPIFHVAPLHGGWMNDPNGPIMYRGRYHLYVAHTVLLSRWHIANNRVAASLHHLVCRFDVLVSSPFDGHGSDVHATMALRWFMPVILGTLDVSSQVLSAFG